LIREQRNAMLDGATSGLLAMARAELIEKARKQVNEAKDQLQKKIDAQTATIAQAEAKLQNILDTADRVLTRAKETSPEVFEIVKESVNQAIADAQSERDRAVAAAAAERKNL